MKPHVFHITTHAGLPGVALSCEGGWGGLRFPDDAAAARAADRSAGGDPYRIERDTGRPARRTG